MKKSCIVLIDGSNLYFKLKDFGLRSLLHFDIQSFIRHISHGETIVSSHFYIGKVRTDGSKKSFELHNLQQKLLAYLRKSHVQYHLGYLLKSAGAYHEKGVDVKIAVDMLVAAYEDTCDQMYLVSSDSDLIPAVQSVRQIGKEVIYVGFQHKKSRALMNTCNQIILMDRKIIRRLIYKKSPTNIK